MTEMNQGPNGRSGAFGDTVAMDLASGRAVDLAELYALDAVADHERQAIEDYISAAPDAERLAFLERVRQARETLATTFRFEEEPPADLFNRIVAQLPDATTQRNDRQPNAGTISAPPATAAGTAGVDELAAARQRREISRQ